MSKRELKQAENVQKSQDRRGGGRGTHGSLTKAGKVRLQTPKIEKTKHKKKMGPGKQNREEFYAFSANLKKDNPKKRKQ